MTLFIKIEVEEVYIDLNYGPIQLLWDLLTQIQLRQDGGQRVVLTSNIFSAKWPMPEATITGAESLTPYCRATARWPPGRRGADLSLSDLDIDTVFHLLE